MCKQIVIFLSLMLFFSLAGESQIRKIGVMPIRTKFIEVAASPLETHPIQMAGKSVDQYEERYLEVVDYYLGKALRSAGFRLAELDLSELPKEYRTKEEQLFNLIRKNQWSTYNLESFNSKSRMKIKQSGYKTGPLANLFADELDRDYLLYTIVMGFHRRSKKEEKNNTYPHTAFGNATLYGLIVNANNGKIVLDVKVEMKQKGINAVVKPTLVTAKKLEKTVGKYVKKLKAEIADFDEQKK